MARTCNINGRGKIARFVWGLLLIAIGVVLIIVWAADSASAYRWIVSACVIAAGLFSCYEGWCGWCIVRAMGFKTPM